MAEPSKGRHAGLFAATGQYLWYALSDGRDPHRDLHPILDLRRKVFDGVKGSSGRSALESGVKLGFTGMFEFQARFGETGPYVFARRLPCRCGPCRAVLRGGDIASNICVVLSATGLFSKHHVAHKKTFSLDETTAKRSKDKEARKQKTLEKITEIATRTAAIREQPENAPNAQAAALADTTAPHADVAFAQVYGAADVLVVSQARGETEFLCHEVDEEGSVSDSEDDGEEDA